MNIYIPSMSRPLNQRTFTRLPAVLKSITKIVVPREEHGMYSLAHGADHVLATDAVGIGPTRDFILNHARAEGQVNIVQLDDDLTIQRLRPGGRIDNATDDEMVQAFEWLDDQLDSYVHAGFAVRFSDKGVGTGDKSPARMMHVLGYNLREIPEDVSFVKGVDDPKLYTMDDFNMTLQLLTRGFANIVSNEWRTSPSPGNARGGASTYRTLTSQNASAHNLKRLFPQFVSIRQKTNWQGMEGGDMVDVTVQWKAAYNHGA